MTNLNADHLLQQADSLVAGAPSRRSRQADLRRAISAAYYSVFHACLGAAADEFVGVGRRATPRYEPVYRSIDHRVFRDVSEEAIEGRLRASYQPFIPTGGLGDDIQAFSITALELQRQRYVAGYAASVRFEAARQSRQSAPPVTRCAGSPRRRRRIERCS